MPGRCVLWLFLFLTGCLGLPEGIEPVDNFELEKYLGKWYEIARLDHSFERGMSNVTADYSLRADGGVEVINRGYLDARGEWKSAHGKARFVGDESRGFLKVSFFGPFYGSYVVFELDHTGYEYALVAGPDKSYLWLLARSPRLDETIKERLIKQARAAGFATDNLIQVMHDRHPVEQDDAR